MLPGMLPLFKERGRPQKNEDYPKAQAALLTWIFQVWIYEGRGVERFTSSHSAIQHYQRFGILHKRPDADADGHRLIVSNATSLATTMNEVFFRYSRDFNMERLGLTNKAMERTETRGVGMEPYPCGTASNIIP
ncbi:hypothetical protein O988_04802 [Pseudogymnoascus sp. VKM F-3808]|nr:hypothetical protein O988_04802 [Pseudogymnoascus sp. VKM F-3808]